MLGTSFSNPSNQNSKAAAKFAEIPPENAKFELVLNFDMANRVFLILFCTILSPIINAQISNINVSGSYDGVFMLSNSTQDYKIAGSPYLSKNWIYGTLELKVKTPVKSEESDNANARSAQHAAVINRCNELIQQISDPKYQTIAVKLTMAEINRPESDNITDVEISNSDFNELPVIIKEFEKKLLAFLHELLDEQETDMDEMYKINGLFRYNLYAQEFEMINDKDTFAIKVPLDVQSISFSNKKFIYGFYVDRIFGNDYLGSSYFEVLNEGACKLLIRHDVKIKSNSGPVTYNWAGGGADSFAKIKQLFYQESYGAEIKPFKKSNKYLKEIFADEYYVIKNYIRAEKININDEAELIKVFTYYNTLDS